MLAGLKGLFRLSKGIWHCSRKFYFEVRSLFELSLSLSRLFFLKWFFVGCLFSPFPSLSNPHFLSPSPLFFMVTLGEKKVFCCSVDFFPPVINAMSSFESKFFHIARLACFVGWFFSSELMSTIDLWRLWLVSKIIFLNFLFNVFQIAEPNMEIGVYDIFKKKYLWQTFLKRLTLDSLLTLFQASSSERHKNSRTA